MPTTKKKTAKKTAAKPFEKLTPAQKRVQIARDVLAQLAAKRFKATHLVWVSKDGNHGINLDRVSNEKEVCDVTKKLKKCNVCAMGGLFVAAVERADALKIGDIDGTDCHAETGREFRSFANDDLFGYLKRFFSMAQLEDIETAFEAGNGATDGTYEAKFFLEGVEEPNDRMRLIMENIIANGGRFDTAKKPVEVVTYSTPGFKG